jgi:hypothetical protein
LPIALKGRREGTGGAPQPQTGARREPLYDVDPRTGISIEVFYADRVGDFRQRRRRLVLVVAPAIGEGQSSHPAPVLRTPCGHKIFAIVRHAPKCLI